MRSALFSIHRGLLVLGATWLLACGPTYGNAGDDGGGSSNQNDNSNTLLQDGGVGQDGFLWPDSTPPDAGQAYQLDGAAATDGCPPDMSNPCGNPVPPGCGTTEICGNGLDDNCNGEVDELCTCALGDVQQCFVGPPGRVDQGACVQGTQTCEGSNEFGHWGPCTGGIWPSAEICDDLDNDCNGCADDGLCCNPVISCPGPGDIQPGQPFTTYQLDGTQWYTGTATSWSWEVVGGPCDDVFIASGNSPSFTLNGANTATPTIEFTLSGDYTVTMTVVTPSGTYTCTFVIHIIGPGLRVELCWEGTGSRDIDLHLLRDDFGASWCDDTYDCYYMNCKAGSGDGFRPDWGYSTSNISECIGTPEGSTWNLLHGHCDNPRLDVDNISTAGIPENINVDSPSNGDVFRVMVHYYSGSGTEHPLVNIYCDGYRVGTYGQLPNQVTGFNSSGGYGCQGNTWRVVDVETLVSGGVTTCNLTALHPPGQTSGYDVRNNDTSY